MHGMPPGAFSATLFPRSGWRPHLRRLRRPAAQAGRPARSQACAPGDGEQPEPGDAPAILTGGCYD